MIFLLIGATLTAFVREPWPLYSFCIVAALLLAMAAWRRQLDQVSFLPFLIPAFGVLQLALATSVYAPATRDAVLKWFALIAILTLAQTGLNNPLKREHFLDGFLVFATITAALCLAQLHTSGGKVLWWLDTGFTEDVYAFFPSRNNYGQFVEFALPVALWRCLGTSSFWYAGSAGLLYSSAIASTSRAAAILATAELVLVPLFILIRSGFPDSRRRAAFVLPAVLGLAVAWTAAVGFDTTLARFREPDALQGRREFAQAALAMASAKPLTGFGLGTFSYAYPQFARVDYPEFVNFAHNDWAEFASDGGFLFPFALLALFALAVPRMTQQPWGLGLLFVAVHAWFDFPFPRLAVAGWMFALLGAMLANPAQAVVRPPAILRWRTAAVMGACLCTLYFSARLGVAGMYFSHDSVQSLRQAIRWAPGESRYYLRLAQLDSSDAPALLKTAVMLNPHNANALIDSALESEISGDVTAAEQLLLQAASTDTTWMPRWSLVNFYFRRGNAPEFWNWAVQAGRLANARRDFVPLFRLAARMDPDPVRMLDIVPNRAPPLRHFLTFELEARNLKAVEPAATRLIAIGDPGNNRPFVLWAVEGFLAQRQPDAALRLWNQMTAASWVPPHQVLDRFVDQPLESSLVWRYREMDGVVRTMTPDGGVRLVFSGQQPERGDLILRYLPVTPGQDQQVTFRYRTEQVPPASGLQWRIESLDGVELGASDSLSSETGETTESVRFTAPSPLVRVRLVYRRASGTARISGAVQLTPPLLSREVSPDK